MTTNVEEIYFSEFERAIIVYTKEYIAISLDVYQELQKPINKQLKESTLALGPITLRYIELLGNEVPQIIPNLLRIEFVILEYKEKRSLINIRLFMKSHDRKIDVNEIINMRSKALELFRQLVVDEN